MVTFPAAEHHFAFAGTGLHCLVTEAHISEHLSEDCYIKVEWPEVGLQCLIAVAVAKPLHYQYQPCQ